MMNQSEFLTSVKMDLGLYGLSLPFEDDDEMIMKVVRLKTLSTYSAFLPYTVPIVLELDKLVVRRNTFEESVYELPEMFNGSPILGIRKIDHRNKMLGQGYVSPMYSMDADLYNGMMLGAANANIYSAIAPPFTFKFETPNILTLYNIHSLSTELIAEVNLKHLPNLSTIKPTRWESFYELALIDVKKFLYQTLKHYKDLQTAYGTISLKIDDWENADSERKDLIEKWRNSYHLEAQAFVVI
jgi:hypothetical protein